MMAAFAGIGSSSLSTMAIDCEATFDTMQLVDERPKLPNFDPDYCLRVLKWSAAICVALFAVQVLILMMVDPSDSHCPGWTIYSGNGSPSPMWLIVALCSGLPATALCCGVICWKSYYKMLYGNIAGTRIPWGVPASVYNKYRPSPNALNSNMLMLVTKVGACLFGTIPFYFMWAHCIK